MTEKLKISIVYFVTAAFVLLNSYLIYKELYVGILIPLAAIMLLLYIFNLESVLFLAVLATPLSVDMGDYDLGVSISVPGEPLLIGIFLFLLLKILLEGGVERRLLKHPVSIAIIINLTWMLITSFSSVLPVVSFKYLLSRLWFIIPVFFGGLIIFRQPQKIYWFVWAYVIALLVVIIYTTKIHSGYGFSEKAGHWVMSPFYNDHTAYGAILAMFVPVVAGFIVDIKSKPFMRIVSLAALLMLLLALYLSYSRAAWVSVGFAVGVLVLVKLKIKFKWIATGTVVLVALFFSFKFEILDRLEKNKQDASANFIEHVQSISNISSDASNLERINRWQAALRMYSEKPFLGWGPGTYQFEYAPFQRSKEKTIISTNLGDMGNSHSEYIGPLAESGWPGLLTVLIMFITIIYSGLKVYSRSENSRSRILSLSVTLGLITYLVHGLLNNFLNTDKASVPFWGFVAIIVAIDLYEIRVKNTDNRPLEE